jgi:hypothetical protein
MRTYPPGQGGRAEKAAGEVVREWSLIVTVDGERFGKGSSLGGPHAL